MRFTRTVSPAKTIPTTAARKKARNDMLQVCRDLIGFEARRRYSQAAPKLTARAASTVNIGWRKKKKISDERPAPIAGAMAKGKRLSIPLGHNSAVKK